MSGPNTTELAPIFHSYGLAVYTCHLLENCLALLLGVIDDERKRQGLPPRTSPVDPRMPKTIGALFAEVRAVEYITVPEKRQIQEAARIRNLLIHSYWSPHKLQAFLTPAGRAWLVDDIDKKSDQIRDADRLVTKFVDSYLARYGKSVESLSASVFDEYVPDDAPPDEVLH